MVRVIAHRYLVAGDYSIKPGDVISEAPFDLPANVLTDFIGKGQATAIFIEDQVVEESIQDEDEYIVLVLDESGEEVMSLHDHEDEEEGSEA